jgi:hypothetical protein
MSKIFKHIVLFTSVIFPVILFGQKSNKEIFKNLYSFENVYKAEVSLFKKDEYNQIDYKELIKVLQCSKGVIAKFVPYKEVMFYEQGGKAHKVYFSETNKYFKIDGKTFVLTKRQSKKVSEILK